MPEYQPCPNCSSSDAVKVNYTWWGGMIGPSLLTHVKCQDCGTAYNGKTGRSNVGGIVAYSVVAAALAIGVIVLFWRL